MNDANQTTTLNVKVLNQQQYIYLMMWFYMQHAKGELDNGQYLTLIRLFTSEDMNGQRFVYHCEEGSFYQLNGNTLSQRTPRGPLMVAVPSTALAALNRCLAEFELLEKSSAPTEPAGESHAATSSLSCPSCNAPQEPAAKFCSQCGSGLPTQAAAKQFCNACGSKLKPEAAFCSACGKAVK